MLNWKRLFMIIVVTYFISRCDCMISLLFRLDYVTLEYVRLLWVPLLPSEMQYISTQLLPLFWGSKICDSHAQI